MKRTIIQAATLFFLTLCSLAPLGSQEVVFNARVEEILRAGDTSAWEGKLLVVRLTAVSVNLRSGTPFRAVVDAVEVRWEGRSRLYSFPAELVVEGDAFAEIVVDSGDPGPGTIAPNRQFLALVILTGQTENGVPRFRLLELRTDQ